MAACVDDANPLASGIVTTCSGESEIENDINQDFTGGSNTVNTLVKIDGDTELENEHELTGSIAGPINTLAKSKLQLFGIYASEDDDVESFEFENEEDGVISLTHNGVGLVAGIAAFEGAGEDGFHIVNEGVISVTRGALDIVNDGVNPFTVVPHGSGLTATSPVVNSFELIAAGIFIHEEETYQAFIENEGTIEAHGQYAYGIFGRSTSMTIVNTGTISADGSEGSAAIVTWDGRARESFDNVTNERQITYGKTFIDNYGEIEGDIVVIDSNNLTNVMTPLQAIARGDDPFIGTTTAQERRDSEINNFGEIEGNLYLFAGSHTVKNAQDAEIEGSIFVDQRRAIYYSTNSATSNTNGATGQPGNPIVGIASRFDTGGDEDDDDGGDEAALSDTYYTSFEDLIEDNPEHHFTLDNAGIIDGDVTVFTYQNIVGLPMFAAQTPSTIDLMPHVTGAGSTDIDNPSLNSGHITGTLSIGTATSAGGDYPTVEDGDTTISETTTISPVIDHVVHSGEWWLVAGTLTGDDLPEEENVIDTVLVDWSAAINSSHSLVIGSQVRSASVIDGLSAPGIAAIDGLLSTDGSDDDTNGLAAALQSSNDASALRKAGEQLAPETNFATQQAALTLAFLTGQHIDNRLANVGATGNGPGANAFPEPSGLGMRQAPEGRMSLGAYDDETPAIVELDRGGMWGQAFGAGLDQNERANVDGYSASIYGAIAGMDNWVAPGIRLGFAGGYGYTDIDGSGDTQSNKTQIDSYLGLVYGAIKGGGWYATGHLGYAWNQYDTTRVLTVPFSDAASASHDGRQYTAAAEVGAPLKTVMGTITPLASLNYSHLDQDGYTETSSGGMALTIADQETTSLQSGLGAKLLTPIAAGTFLEGRAIWFHEFEDTNQQVTAAFGGASSFTVAGPSVGRDTANIGAGLFAYVTPGTSFQLNYDALLRDDFVGHTGSGHVRVEF